MHRFSSKSTIVRFRLVACLICLKCLLIPGVFGLLVYSFITTDHHLTLVAMGMGLAAFLTGILQWMLASRTRCPLCMTPVLASRGCAKHRHARSFMGSHRLRAALAILFRDSFTCPYCNEKSALEVRSRQPRSQAKHY